MLAFARSRQTTSWAGLRVLESSHRQAAKEFRGLGLGCRGLGLGFRGLGLGCRVQGVGFGVYRV